MIWSMHLKWWLEHGWWFISSKLDNFVVSQNNYIPKIKYMAVTDELISFNLCLKYIHSI